jgi:hypothetical protein
LLRFGESLERVVPMGTGNIAQAGEKNRKKTVNSLEIILKIRMEVTVPDRCRIGTYSSAATQKPAFQAALLKSSLRILCFFISLWSCRVVIPEAFAVSLMLPLFLRSCPRM